MSRRMVWLVCCVVSFLAAGALRAEVDRWSRVGPKGARVRGLAIDPREPNLLLLATEGGGMYRSTDEGLSWEESSSGLPFGARLDGLTRDRDAGAGTIFYCAALSTSNPGLYRSTDDGATWEALSALDGVVLSSPVLSIAVNPHDHQTMLFGSFSVALRRSTDAGVTSSVVGPSNVRSLTFDPYDAQRAYAGLGTGLIRSVDGGATWTAPVTGLPSTVVWQVVAHPALAGRLFAATDAGVYRSTDSGASWSLSSIGVGGAHRLSFDPGQVDRLVVATTIGQLHLSQDGGVSWSRITTPSGFFFNLFGTVAFLPGSGDLIATEARDRGLFRSADLGITWSDSSQGLKAVPIQSLAFDPIDPSRVYAGGEASGIFRSLDGGRTWEIVHGTGDVRALIVDPNAPNIIWAAAVPGLLRSTDFGASWSAPPSPPGGSFALLTSVAVNAHDSTQILIGIDSQGAFLSLNDGGSFTQVGPFFSGIRVVDVLFDPFVPDRQFIALGFGRGVHRSQDGGLSWAPLPGAIQTAGLNSFAADPLRQGVLYAGGPSRFLTSQDGGSTWAQSATPPNATNRTIAPHPRAAGVIYAGGNSAGVFLSRDSGATWQTWNDGLTNLWVNDIAIDPRQPHRLLAATRGGGIFERTQLTIFNDGFESGDTSAWSATEP